MKVVLRGPRAIADDILAPMMQRVHIKSIVSASWDYFTTSHIHCSEGHTHVFFALVRIQLQKEWGRLKVVCQAANRIAQVHKVIKCWDKTMIINPDYCWDKGDMRRITMGLLFRLIRHPDMRLLPMPDWIRLTSCCPQFRVMRTRSQYMETHHHLGTQFQ